MKFVYIIRRMNGMKHWLMKSEPEAYSIDDLERDQQEHWDGIRNYQARNLMRDEMRVGDQVLFYHSSCAEPGVVGLAEVCKEAYPDFTAWDPQSKYFDPKASPDNPIWLMVDLQYKATLSTPITLKQLRTVPELEGLLLLKKGMRLSVQPVSEEHYQVITGLIG